jgi:8-oxo-dGTP diphosphatase
MLKIIPPNYKYCPHCATKLKLRKREGKQQKYCPKCNWIYYPHVFSAINTIVYKNNKVLLVERARDPYKNTWQLPGGYVSFGEHPKDTAVRELTEETGLKTTKTEFIEMIQTNEDPRAPGLFVFFYKVYTKGKIKNMDPSENTRIDWFNVNSLPKISWESHKKILKKLQTGQV